MKNVFSKVLFSASYRLRDLTDPALYGSPYEPNAVYEKPFNFKKFMSFRKRMGFHI